MCSQAYVRAVRTVERKRVTSSVAVRDRGHRTGTEQEADGHRQLKLRSKMPGGWKAGRLLGARRTDG